MKDLVSDLAKSEEMDEAELLDILLESEVLTALHTLEAVKAKVQIIDGLAQRIERRDPENSIRDYIAEHPELISPSWEFSRKRDLSRTSLVLPVRNPKSKSWMG